MTDHIPPPPDAPRSQRIWNWLTAPLVPMSPNEGRFAQLLASLIIALLPLVLLIALLPVVTRDVRTAWSLSDVRILVSVMLLWVASYGLVRMGRPRTAAILAVIATVTAVFLAAVLDRNIHYTHYLMIVILFSSLFMSMRTSLVLVGLVVLGIILLPLTMSDLSWTGSVVDSVSFIVFGAVSVWLARTYLTRQEQDRKVELTESEQRYRRLVESSPITIAVHQNGRVVYINSAGLAMLGANSPDQVVGKPVLDFVVPEYRAMVIERMRQTQQTGQQAGLMAEKFITLDGRVIDVEVVALPMTYLGQPATQVIVIDITERTRAADVLHRSEAKTRALLDAIPDLIFQISREGIFLDYKTSGMGLLVPPEMFLGKSIYDVMPDLADQTMSCVRLALNTGDIQVFSYQLPFEGAMHDYEARLVASGEDEVVVIVRDVTERTQADRLVRETQARSAAILSAIPDLMLMLDREGRFLGLEAAGREDLLIAPADQLLEGRVSDFLPPDVAALALKYNNLALDTGTIQVFEYALDVVGGRRDFEARLVPSGENEVLVIVRDMTERRRAEEALHRRDTILQTVAYAGERLLTSASLDDVLPDVLARLGQAAGVSRAYLFENHTQPDGDLRTSQRYEWCAPGVSAQIGNPELQALPYENAGFGGWVPTLQSGQAVYGPVADLPTPARELLEREEILSIILVPIFSGDAWWGLLGFDDCVQVREWAAAEIEALRSVAGILGAAILRHRSEAAEREQRALAEALRDTAAMLNSTLDRDDLLDRILITIERVVPHDAASIGLIDGDISRIVRCRGFEKYDLEDVVMALVLPVRDLANLRHMLETRQALVIPDITANPNWVKFDDSGVMASFVGAPILMEGEVIGFVHLQSVTPGFFNQSHADRLMVFANQVAIAMRNTQLYDSAQRTAAELEALRLATLDITARLDLDALLTALVERAIQLLGVEAGGVYLYRPDLDVLEWSVNVGGPTNPLGAQLRRGEALSGKVWERNEPMYVDSYGDWSERKVEYDQYTGAHKAVVGAPICWQDQFLGVITARTDRAEHKFSEHDARLLSLFASQAAIAIQNARLYGELQRYAEELAALYRGTSFLFTSLLASGDLADLGIQIAQAVVKEFDTVDCGVMLVDHEHKRLVQLGRAGDYQIDCTAPLSIEGPGLLTTALKTGQVVYAPNVNADPRYLMSDPRTQSELVLPLLTANGVIGVLDLQSTTLNAFSTQDRRILAAFAERVAAAIENRQLVAEIRRYTDELEQRVVERTVDLSVRNAVAETLSSSLDMHEMLNGVLRTTIEQLGVLGGAIHLFDADSSSLDMVACYGVSEHTLSTVTGIVPGVSDLRAIGSVQNAAQSAPPNVIQQTGISAVLSVPIWRQEQIHGVITLVHDEPRPWRSEETRMLDAIGRQIGVALANARLYADTVRDEAHLRTILQSVADGLLVFDRDHNLTLINPAAETLFAFYPPESGGAQQAARYLWAWLRMQAGEMPSLDSVEFTLPMESSIGGQTLVDQCKQQNCPIFNIGDPRWPCWLRATEMDKDFLSDCPVYRRAPSRALQAHLAAVCDAEGIVLGTAIALHDVTYFRELDDLKGRFVQTVSHELRTPLSAVMLQVSTLIKYYDRFDDGERREMLNEVQQQSQVLRELIEDILELSRFDAKRAAPQKRWFDLGDQYREVLVALRPMIEQKRLQIDADDCGTSGEILGDPHQLTRVFHNLVSNAVKYTPPGGRIALRMERDDGEVRLLVSDTGIGIPLEQQARIFDRFFRVEDAARMASGTGLGLAITKEIIDLHGGTIELRSAPGQGSTFTIRLPVPDRGTAPDSEIVPDDDQDGEQPVR